MKSWKGSVPTSQKKRLNKYFFHFVGAQTLSRWVTNSLFHAGFLPTFVSEGRKKPLYCSMFSGAPAAAVYGNSCLLANRPVFILCHASCQQRHLKNNFHAQRKGSAPPLPAAHFLSPVFQMLIWRSFWWWIVGWDEPAVPLLPHLSPWMFALPTLGCSSPVLPWASAPSMAQTLTFSGWKFQTWAVPIF